MVANLRAPSLRTMNLAALVAAEAASFHPVNAHTATGDFSPGCASTFRYSTAAGYQARLGLSETPEPHSRRDIGRYHTSGAQGFGFQANIASPFATAAVEPSMRPARANGQAEVPPR